MYRPAWLRHLQRQLFGSTSAQARRRARKVARSRSCVRLHLEDLEARLTPSNFTINVNDNSDRLDNSSSVTVSTLGSNVTLRDALNAANNTGGSNTFLINLQNNTTYDLTAVDNYWYGPDGLPAIASTITIEGNGSIIQRDAASGTPNFRLFYVSGGFDGLAAGNLTLENLTLEGGVAKGGDSYNGGGGLGAGGAIFNQGTLTLTGVTVTKNLAAGGSAEVSSAGAGGGGMGQDAPTNGAGGGFGGSLGGTFGGAGGSGGGIRGGGGGGGGFASTQAGTSGTTSVGGVGGGKGGFGGVGGGNNSTITSDGGGGGTINSTGNIAAGNGGRFGSGGGVSFTTNSGAGGGGG